MARILDPFVEAHLLATLEADPVREEPSGDTEAIEAAVHRVEEAEHELATYLSFQKAAGAPDAFAAGLKVRRDDLDEARVELAEAQRATMIPDNLPSGDLAEAWPALSTAEKRRILSAVLDAVVVRSVRASGRKVPVAERALVLWRGEAPANLPRRGRRVPLTSFDWPPAEAGPLAQ